MQIESDLSLDSRFSWIVAGKRRGPHEVFDEDLADFADAAVVPTQGALVAEWLLVVPRRKSLSVSELKKCDRKRILAIADEVAGALSPHQLSHVIFEHGPRYQRSLTGCGVDQAHLHVIGGQLDLLERLMAQVAEVSWFEADFNDPWSAIATNVEYFLIRNSERAVWAPVETPTSQRLRKAVAYTFGKPNEWDYKLHPNEWNARRTKERFRGGFASFTD